MQLGENCCTARSTRRENFSPRTPLSITTRLGMHYSPSNNASAGRLNRDRSTAIKGWLELKRQVRKGEKGLSLCMPVTYKKRVSRRMHRERAKRAKKSDAIARFVFRAYWFVLAQTEGEAMYEQPIPGFDLDAALQYAQHHAARHSMKSTATCKASRISAR